MPGSARSEANSRESIDLGALPVVIAECHYRRSLAPLRRRRSSSPGQAAQGEAAGQVHHSVIAVGLSVVIWIGENRERENGAVSPPPPPQLSRREEARKRYER